MAQNDQHDFISDKSGSSPARVILIIAVVLAVAGIGYLFAGRAGVLLSSGDGSAPLVEEMVEDANPFPETEALNLPPVEEMVDEAPEEGAAPVTGQAPADTTGASSDETQAMTTTIDIDKAMGVRALGNPDAPIKLAEYFSLTCNHCANFHNITLPQIKQYIDNGDVYLEFREFPLNAPALRASMVARCLPEDRYFGYISLLFKTQDTWMTNPDYMGVLRQNAKLAGMSDERFDACVANNELQQAIGAAMQEATGKWQIESTPTFVVNDGAETIKGAQPAYEFERVFRAVTGGQVAPLLKDKEKTE